MKSISANHLTPLFFSATLALTLMGCSTITYEEPKTEPLARVRFVTDTDHITVVRSYTSTNCEGENEMMRLRNGFILNSSPKRLDIPLWDYHDNAAKEFYVAANNLQIYMFEGNEQSGRALAKCGVAIKQTFEEGKDYEVSFKMKYLSCAAQVTEIKNNESGHLEKIVLQKRNSKLGTEFTKTCIAEFKKSRL